MKNRDYSGMGILGILQVIFLVLKFTGLIKWSWPVVLIPLWISLIIFVVFIISVIVAVCGHYKWKK